MTASKQDDKKAAPKAAAKKAPEHDHDFDDAKAEKAEVKAEKAERRMSREQEAKELDKHFEDRTRKGLPAHRPQEFHSNSNGVEVHTLGGVVYVKTDGEVRLDQADVFTLINELRAAFQGAV